MYHRMNIAGLSRDLPLCKLNENLYIGAFVIFGDPELTVAAAAELLKKAPPYDYVITAEAKGIPLAHEMARQNHDETYFVARKYPKLYMTGLHQVTVKSITTDKEQTLYLDVTDAEKMKGKRILLVDDVISTGESIAALQTLVESTGAIIAGKCAILAEGEACDRDDIFYLEKLPLFDTKGQPIG